MDARELLRRARERLEEAVGFSVVDTDYLRVQEATAREAYNLANELEEFGYVAVDAQAGRPHEANAPARRRWVQKARSIWKTDPQAGASVELLNEFTFGRGVPKPRAKEEEVQKVIDEFWDDPQNQRVLTSYTAQLKLGNSLSIQSSVFFLIFDEGDDGKLKLSFLNHDTVEQAVTDPSNRQRVLYFTARKVRQGWDFKADRPKMPNITDGAVPKLYYYEVWGAVKEATEERGASRKLNEAGEELVEAEVGSEGKVKITPPTGDRGWLIEAADDDEPLELAPRDRVGEGAVYHLTENTDMEEVFGTPRMRRTMRWYSAYNDYMASRVDMMTAAAAFIMRRKVKGTGTTLEKMAGKAMRATSDLQTAVDVATDRVPGPATAASILQEQGMVEHEPFNLDTRAGNALTDGQMLRAQVSAGDRFPQHYLGDVGSASLATATSMELPVLKHVEARQELVESLFRFCIDRAIELAVEKGRLDPNQKGTPSDEELVGVPTEQDNTTLLETVDMLWRINGKQVIRETRVVAYTDHPVYGTAVGYELAEAHEDKQVDEDSTGLDLGYEFGLPSPLRRMMGDVVTAVATVAQTFDPNNTNPELSRLLLAFTLAEALEMPDAQDAVDKIFPPGYVPPELAAMQQQQGGGPQGPQPNFFSPDATALPSDPSNAYSAPKTATRPEDVPMQQSADEGPRITIGRAGQPVVWPGRRPTAGSESPVIQTRVNGRVTTLDRLFDREVRGETMEALAALTMNRLVDDVTDLAHSALNGKD